MVNSQQVTGFETAGQALRRKVRLHVTVGAAVEVKFDYGDDHIYIPKWVRGVVVRVTPWRVKVYFACDQSCWWVNRYGEHARDLVRVVCGTGSGSVVRRSPRLV